MTPRELFETRRLEVFLAGTSTVLGAWLVLPFDSMATAAFTQVLNAAPEMTWGWLFFFNGLSHILALIINGRRWWSPIIRWCAALTAAGVYAGFALGFAAENYATTGVPVYACLSGGAMICLVFAWKDARLALRIKYAACHA